MYLLRTTIVSEYAPLEDLVQVQIVCLNSFQNGIVYVMKPALSMEIVAPTLPTLMMLNNAELFLHSDAYLLKDKHQYIVKTAVLHHLKILKSGDSARNLWIIT